MRITDHDISDEIVSVQQNKTGTIARIIIEDELESLMKRIYARKSGYKVRSLALIVDHNGQKLTASALRGHFNRAREARRN